MVSDVTSLEVLSSPPAWPAIGTSLSMFFMQVKHSSCDGKNKEILNLLYNPDWNNRPRDRNCLISSRTTLSGQKLKKESKIRQTEREREKNEAESNEMVWVNPWKFLYGRSYPRTPQPTLLVFLKSYQTWSSTCWKNMTFSLWYGPSSKMLPQCNSIASLSQMSTSWWCYRNGNRQKPVGYTLGIMNVKFYGNPTNGC